MWTEVICSWIARRMEENEVLQRGLEVCGRIHGKNGAAIFVSLKVETWEGQVWPKEGGIERSVWDVSPPMEMSSRQLNTRIWNIGQRSRSRCTFVSNPNIVGFEIQET